MISLRRIFGLMLLFLFFEAVVAVVTTLAYPSVNVFLACVAMTALAVGVWGFFVLLTRVMMRPRAPQPPPMPRSSAPTPRPVFVDNGASQDLSGLISEANRRLANALPANSRGESPTVTTLPLYLVIGGEASGKTSAILNSGMEPQLLAGEASREGAVTPTRLCNFWFAEGAIFADFAGRAVTQETENWERMLRVLSQTKRIPKWKQLLLGRQSRSELRGLVLVCDASLFVSGNDPQRSIAFARTLSDRLQMVGTVFQREFPVYVLFSKCDSVKAFPEFFAQLNDAEGRRLLGATLPLVRQKNDTADIYADREGKRLTTFFTRLYWSLGEKRLALLARQEEAAKKSTGYEFPRELKKLRADFVQFLLDVFRPNPLQPGPRLRGFYLSGQRWIARNVSPVGDGSMAGFTLMSRRADATMFLGSKDQAPAAGIPGPARMPGAIAKWVFLSDLFHNVILKDRSGIAAPRVKTRDQEYRNFALAGVGVVLLILSMIWANSWRQNRELLNSVEATVESLHAMSPQDAAAPEPVADLESLRSPLARLLNYDRSGPPWSYRWGLYSGRDVTGSLADLYFERFRVLFMDPLLQTLTAHLSQLDASNPVKDDVYTLLKSYRMVTSGECKPDAAFLNNSLLPMWASIAVPASADVAPLAEKQMEFYVSELTIRNPYQLVIAEDGKTVARAQAYLHEFNGPSTVFHLLVEQVNHDKQGDMLSRYVPNFGEVMTGPNSIDAAYTREGWDAMIDSIQNHKVTSAGERCVIGSQSRVKDVAVDAENEREVEDLYVKNYVQRWKSFLEAHHVAGFNGAQDAANRLHILADNNRSALLGLVYMTVHNTDLAAASSGESAVAKKIEDTRSTVSKTVQHFLGNTDTQSPANPLAPATHTTGQDIVREFKPASALVDPANSEKWLNSNNQPYLLALDELGNSIAAMPIRIDTKEPADTAALDRANKALQAATTAHHALGALLPNTEAQIDVDLNALLAEPIRNAERIIRAVPVKPIPPPPPPPPPPPDPVPAMRAHVNGAAQLLCAHMEEIRGKYPFNSMATQEVTIQDLNTLFAPGTGAFAQFSQQPDVSKVYLRQGKAWSPNAASFNGEYSQGFIQELDGFSDLSSALYTDGTGNPHFELTLTLDGTGKVPYELDVDGHVILYNPKKGAAIQRLVWPPVTNAPTRLVVNAGMKLQLQYTGMWGLFRLLSTADRQEGNVFVFRTVQVANGGKNPLQDSKGNPITVQIHVDSPAAGIFGSGYFSQLRCENFRGWAVR
jgi:type VI secretion system protein ImpL